MHIQEYVVSVQGQQVVTRIRAIFTEIAADLKSAWEEVKNKSLFLQLFIARLIVRFIDDVFESMLRAIGDKELEIQKPVLKSLNHFMVNYLIIQEEKPNFNYVKAFWERLIVHPRVTAILIDKFLRLLNHCKGQALAHEAAHIPHFASPLGLLTQSLAHYVAEAKAGAAAAAAAPRQVASAAAAAAVDPGGFQELTFADFVADGERVAVQREVARTVAAIRSLAPSGP